MPKNVIIGIHIGTTACRIAAFNDEGEILAQNTKEYSVDYGPYGWAEQNPECWWEAVCEILREFFRKAMISAEDVVAVGVDGQSWNALPVDDKGKPLRNSMTWLDRRATDEARYLLENIGDEEISRVNSNPVDPAYIVPKILWIKKNEQEVFKKTYKFVQSNSYIVYKLTGKFSMDRSQGYGFHFFDLNTGRWSEELSEKMGIPLEKMPDLYNSADVVGEVTQSASLATGLKKGTPVIAGGLDAATGTLGAGVLEHGQIQEQGGQAGNISVVVNKPVKNKKLILGYHVVPGCWLLQGGTVGGGSLKWFVKQLGHLEMELSRKTGISEFKIIDQEAGSVPPGSDGLIFMPYMAGERSPIWDQNAKGVFFGLTYDKTRAHMARAIMEGCVYALNHNIQTVESTGINVSELVSVGGSANSYLWTQMKADITNKIIKVPISDMASPLGSAILAGVGVGLFKDFKEAVNRVVFIKSEYHPNEELHKEYQFYYSVYMELYENLKKSFEKISQKESARY